MNIGFACNSNSILGKVVFFQFIVILRDKTFITKAEFYKAFLDFFKASSKSLWIAINENVIFTSEISAVFPQISPLLDIIISKEMHFWDTSKFALTTEVI